MKKSLVITIFLLYSINSFSQDTLYFPVTHHIITLDNGSGGQNVAYIPVIISELNRIWGEINIQFYMSCTGIDTIKNSNFIELLFLVV